MITRLTPEQVSEKWDIVKYAVENSIPPSVVEGDVDVINNIFSALMRNEMQCWVVSKEDKVFVVATTAFTYDKFSGVKNLLIYNLYGYRKVPNELWNEGMQAIKNFAQSKNCNTITAFTDNDRVVEIANQIGGDSGTTFIKFNLNKEE